MANGYIAGCDSANLYVNKVYAYSLFLQFKYDEAISQYKKLISQGYDNFESNFVLGLCYENNPNYCNYFKAQKCFARAVTFNSENTTCMYHLGLMEKYLHMDSLAVEHLNKSIEVAIPKGRAFNIYQKLAEIHYEHKCYAEAVRAFELCILYDDEDAPLNYYNAAQMFIAAKDADRARLYLQTFVAKADGMENNEQNRKLVDTAKVQLRQQ